MIDWLIGLHSTCGDKAVEKNIVLILYQPWGTRNVNWCWSWSILYVRSNIALALDYIRLLRAVKILNNWCYYKNIRHFFLNMDQVIRTIPIREKSSLSMKPFFTFPLFSNDYDVINHVNYLHFDMWFYFTYNHQFTMHLVWLTRTFPIKHWHGRSYMTYIVNI